MILTQWKEELQILEVDLGALRLLNAVLTPILMNKWSWKLIFNEKNQHYVSLYYNYKHDSEKEH